MSALDKYLPYADQPTPKPEKGTWVLISPSGKRYEADEPVNCLRAEIEDRVPPHVALGRIARAMKEDGEQA